MTHMLNLVLQSSGFGIEEQLNNSRRILKDKLISAAEGRRMLTMLSHMSYQEFENWLNTHGYPSWFGYHPPSTTGSLPIVLESRTLAYEN